MLYCCYKSASGVEAVIRLVPVTSPKCDERTGRDVCLHIRAKDVTALEPTISLSPVVLKPAAEDFTLLLRS